MEKITPTLPMRSLEDFDYRDKTVILRVDINSPIDPETRKITNENRINMSLPTIRYLLDHKARIAMLSHQGDTLDYQNLIPLAEHAQKLSEKLDAPIDYIDDVAGPAAQRRIRNLKSGQAVLLGNLRYLAEEVSTFENAVKLKPRNMLDTYLVRNLAPLADFYVNDAFAAAHRNAPSMTAFQEILPSAAGFLFFNEIEALTRVMENPQRPAVFILGGAKISDAFGMMRQVLTNGTADKILACGVTGIVMLMAKGYDLGNTQTKFITDRSLDAFIPPAREYLDAYPDRIVCPVDLAFEKNGKRMQLDIDELPCETLFPDIGEKSISLFREEIRTAGTLFVNGPPGMYENSLFESGTRAVFQEISRAGGYSVIGGGDSVTAATRYVDLESIDYICTAGGAMVRFLSGVELPLLKAMADSYSRIYSADKHQHID